MSDLRPCPFCGGQNLRETRGYVIECKDCGGEAHKDWWNNRPLLDEAVEALKFYADESNWDGQGTRDYGVVECSFNGGNEAVHDGYERAQQALSKLDVEVEE